MKKWIIGAIAIALTMGFAQAVGTQIMVVDFDTDEDWLAYDLSTGTMSTNGLTASASVTGEDYLEPNKDYYWNRKSLQFLTDQTATWTVTGYAPGTVVNVYVHWRDEDWQNNLDSAASYAVNGGTVSTKNQQVPGSVDLTLNDGVNDHDFESLGQFAADGAGQVQVVVTNGVLGESTAVDAVAFEVPPQGTMFIIQ